MPFFPFKSITCEHVRWVIDGFRWVIDGFRWVIDGSRWVIDGLSTGQETDTAPRFLIDGARDPDRR